jgi:hypothetical protein
MHFTAENAETAEKLNSFFLCALGVLGGESGF